MTLQTYDDYIEVYEASKDMWQSIFRQQEVQMQLRSTEASVAASSEAEATAEAMALTATSEDSRAAEVRGPQSEETATHCGGEALVAEAKEEEKVGQKQSDQQEEPRLQQGGNNTPITVKTEIIAD